MNKLELEEWKCFDLVLKNFLCVIEVENHEELVKSIMITFENLGYNASFNVHYLLSSLDWLPNSLKLTADK